MHNITDGIALNIPRLLMQRGASLPAPALAALNDRAAVARRSDAPSVIHKTATPPSGDKHDYMSVGPYWWPDPAKPDGLPYIRRDGHINPEFHSDRYDRPALEAMHADLRDLTLAWTVWRKPEDLEAASRVVRTWFLAPATRMNPNLLFGQAIPGHCTGRGIGLIDTAHFPLIIDLALLLHQAGGLTHQDLSDLRAWFTAFLDWMLTHEFGIDERRQHNNHGTWFDVQAAAYALFVGRDDIAREIITSVPHNRIAKHIEPDGRQPHELARTRSFSYSCYNLEAFFTLAEIAQHIGIDLWNARLPDGRGLRPAIDFLAGYLRTDEPWPYEQLASEPTSRLKGIYPLLRRAALAWPDSDYTALATSLPEHQTDYAAYLLWAASDP